MREQPPLLHLQLAIGQSGEIAVMRDEQQAEAFVLAQRLEQRDDFLFRLLVEVARRLVGEQKPRPVDQRAGDSDAPLLAAGHLARKAQDAARESDARQQIMRARIGRFRRDLSAEHRRQRDIIDRAQIGQQARKLENEADAPPAQIGARNFGQRPDAFVSDDDLAFGWARQRPDHGEKRGLAGARSSDDRDEFAGLYAEIGAVDSVDAGQPVAIGFAQANGAQDHGALSIWIMR